MHGQHPRNLWLLVISLSGISAIGWYINAFAPQTLPILLGFFFCVFVTAFSSSLFLLNNVRRSILLSTFFTGALILRAIHLREPLYIILLAACLTSLELLFQKR